MPPRYERRVGEIGVPIRIRIESSPGIAEDISSATSLEIFLRDPSGNISSPYAASFVTDGTDGEFEYLTESGVLDEAGKWRFWGRVVTDTQTKITPEFSFWVVENG